MLYLLDARILVAMTAMAVARCPSVCADCPVAARSAGDTAQRPERRREMRGRRDCAGGDARGVGPITVSHISPD